jgi:LEA14-like dessication related protein
MRSLPSPRRLAAAVVLLGALGGCLRPQSPTVTPEVARVVRVTPQGLELQVTLAVENPNGAAVDVREVAGTLILDGGQKLGTGRSQPRRSIPPKSSSPVDCQVRIAWENLPALREFVTREQVPYTFQGKVTLGGDAVHFTLPFEMHGTLLREQLLQAGLRGIFGER